VIAPITINIHVEALPAAPRVGRWAPESMSTAAVTIKALEYAVIATRGDGSYAWLDTHWATLDDAREAAERVRAGDDDGGVNPVVCAIVPVPEDES
jgi:hypothetical protein